MKEVAANRGSFTPFYFIQEYTEFTRVNGIDIERYFDPFLKGIFDS